MGQPDVVFDQVRFELYATPPAGLSVDRPRDDDESARPTHVKPARRIYHGDDIVKLTHGQTVGAHRFTLTKSVIKGDGVYEHGVDAAGGYDEGTIAYNTFVNTGLGAVVLKQADNKVKFPDWDGNSCDSWAIHDNLVYGCGLGLMLGAGGQGDTDAEFHATDPYVYNNIIVSDAMRAEGQGATSWAISVQGVQRARLYNNTLVNGMIRFTHGENATPAGRAWLQNEDAEVYNNVILNRWNTIKGLANNDPMIWFTWQTKVPPPTEPPFAGDFLANHNSYQVDGRDGVRAPEFQHWERQANPIDFEEWKRSLGPAPDKDELSDVIKTEPWLWVLHDPAAALDYLDGHRLTDAWSIIEVNADKTEFVLVKRSGQDADADRVRLNWAFRGEGARGDEGGAPKFVARNRGAHEWFALSTDSNRNTVNVRGLFGRRPPAPVSCVAVTWGRELGEGFTDPGCIAECGYEGELTWRIEDPEPVCEIVSGRTTEIPWTPDPQGGLYYIQAIEASEAYPEGIRASQVEALYITPYARNYDLIFSFQDAYDSADE